MRKPTKTSIVFLVLFLLALIAGGVFISNHWRTVVYLSSQDFEESKAFVSEAQKFIEEERVKLAGERSSQAKGLYMNEFIANSQSQFAVNTRRNIENLLEETELNSLVIDVKEAPGPNLPDSLKKLINELHQKNIWIIARVCVFRDSSLIEEKPGWYLKSLTAASSNNLWQDPSGEYWLDPESQEAQDYIIDFSKEVIDFGFDELQFDYIRFPSDGDIENVIYPVYDGEKERTEVIQRFSSKLSEGLKSYKPSIILSVDLFGNLAAQFQATEIGQKLSDAAENFDYISFMLYPSHFYGGFGAEEDLKRELPAFYFPYEAEDISQVVSNHPYEVISRSIFSASDYLSLFGSEAKIRPWLQDFDLTADISRGIIYDAEKIRTQIKAAEDSGASGWLLWNPSNTYTEEALREIE